MNAKSLARCGFVVAALLTLIRSADAAPRPSRLIRANLAPRKLWMRTLSGATSLRVEEAKLIVRRDDAGIKVLDPSDGRTVLELVGADEVRLSSGLALASRAVTTDTGASKWLVEAKSLETGETAWSVNSERRPRLGPVVNGAFYFGDPKGIHRVAVPPANPPQRQFREIEGGAWRPVVGGGKVYFNSDGHVIYGLDAGDLTRGWWTYCDFGAAVADEEGVYGSTSIGYGFEARKKDRSGFVQPGWRLDFFRQFARGDYAIAGDTLVIGGQDVRYHREARDEQRVHVISPYLYSLNKKSQALSWRVPMEAMHPRIVGDKVVVWAGHRRGRKGYVEPEYAAELIWRLEVRQLATGRLLWRSRPRSKELPPAPEAIGKRFFLLEDGVLKAFEAP